MTALLVFVLLSPQERERLVATIPEGVEAGHVAFSPDGKVAAFSMRKAGRFHIVAGPWTSKAFALAGLPILRQEGTKVFFYAIQDREAPVVYQNDKVLFETSTEWTWTLPGSISENGAVVASIVNNEDRKKTAVALNGKLQKPHSGRGDFAVLSKNGAVFAFGLEKEDGYCVVVNDVPGPVYDWITLPALSADGKVVAYGAETKNEFLVIHGDRKIPVKSVPKGVFLSEDGSSVGYWRVHRKEGDRRLLRVIAGDTEGPEFLEIKQPTFSPDAKHVAYWGEIGGTSCVVIDTRTFEAPGIQTGPVFLAGGKGIGYGARIGRELWWKTAKVE